MTDPLRKAIDEAKRERVRPLVSAVLEDGSIVETLFDPGAHRTFFCVAKGGEIRSEADLVHYGQRYIPYSPNNNLLRNEVVLLPSAPEAYV